MLCVEFFSSYISFILFYFLPPNNKHINFILLLFHIFLWRDGKKEEEKKKARNFLKKLLFFPVLRHCLLLTDKMVMKPTHCLCSIYSTAVKLNLTANVILRVSLWWFLVNIYRYLVGFCWDLFQLTKKINLRYIFRP